MARNLRAMPIPMTAAEIAALEESEAAVRTLIDFYLPSGRYSFWDGPAHWQYDNTRYLACSDFGQISSITYAFDLGAEGIEMKLNGTKLQELSPDPLDPGALFGSIENENYQMRPCVIRFVFIDPRSGRVLFTKRRYLGLIDQMMQTDEPDEESGVFNAYLVVKLESAARRYGLRGGRTRSNADQQEIWPGDEFFKFTEESAARNSDIWWGRTAPIASARKSSFGGRPISERYG